MDRDTRDYFFKAMMDLPPRAKDMILAKAYGALESERYYEPYWLLLDDIQDALDRM